MDTNSALVSHAVLRGGRLFGVSALNGSDKMTTASAATYKYKRWFGLRVIHVGLYSPALPVQGSTFTHGPREYTYIVSFIAAAARA